MNEELTNKINELKNMGDMHYYYHVTNKNCDSILENGLYMVEDKIYTTAISIPDEFWNNPIEFAKNEQGMFYRSDANIIIIGVDNNSINNFIETTNMIPDGWELDTPPLFYIPSRFIAGYIDVNDEDLILNDNFDNAYRMNL